jgi:hypothetical protein
MDDAAPPSGEATVVASLEIYHSRPAVPTRRVALGSRLLPVDPAPGVGGALLGGIVAANVHQLDDDLIGPLVALTRELEDGRLQSRTRLRHRYQIDHVGLQSSTHRLVRVEGRLRFDFDGVAASPTQNVLGAVYAAAEVPAVARAAVMSGVRRAIGWTGPVGDDLIAALSGFGSALADPVAWANATLDLTGGESRREIQRRFRELLYAAHPDRGGDATTAPRRLGELLEARRILLGR